MLYVFACSLLVLAAANSYREEKSSDTGYYGGGADTREPYHDYPGNSYPDQSEHECKKIKVLTLDNHIGVKPDFKTVERHGTKHVFISCPNNSSSFALVARKRGYGVKIPNKLSGTALLATGLNAGVLARCGKSGRYTALTANGSDKIKLRRVTCVRVEQSVTTL